MADVEALTNTTGLLDSLADNFAGVVAHRQTSPDSRDWLSRLMGTRELWQSTNQTDGHGSRLSGRGSSRRVREFRIPPDVFATLGTGQAVIHTPEGLQAQHATITALELPDTKPDRIDRHGSRHPTEIAVHPENLLPLAVAASDRHQASPESPERRDIDEDPFDDI